MLISIFERAHGGWRVSGGAGQPNFQNIARLERGVSVPSTNTLQRIAKATGHKLIITFEKG